jgi:hypothetical protein
MEKFRAEGKIRAYGVALGPKIGWLEEGVRTMRERDVAGVQMIYNLLEQDPGRPLIEAARETNTSLVVRVPHSSGMWEGKYDEDTTFAQIPGQFDASDYPVLGEGSYTARRIEVDGRGEGPRLSDCGPVTLEDSFIRIHGADPGTPACNDVHSDGVQAVAGVGAIARNNTIIMQTPCGTSPWFVVNPRVNTGLYVIDRLLVAGGGYTFRQEVAGSVTGLRIVDRSWVYGPLDEMDCSALSPWEAKLVTIDADYQITRSVNDLPCH